jgi:predicted metal-binding protein
MMTDQTKTKTIATICRRTGQTCQAAGRAADQLAQAAAVACAAQPGFSMIGQLRLAGCAQGCLAQFTLDAARVDLFCDVTPDISSAALSAFANSFFETGRPLFGLGALTEPPAAMVRHTILPASQDQRFAVAMQG